MMNKGILPINKPKDWTSFDVCNKLKHMLKPLKVGHLGTLDPMATGVLLVTVGKATKLFDIMQEKKKTYIAEFEFGKETDTLDATGTIIKEIDKIPTKDEIVRVLKLFVGKINQIPPKYSVSNIMGFLKGKSSIMIYNQWGNMKYKYRNRQFWCRGYYVDTVGKNTKKIKEYIANQLKEDRMTDQLTLEEMDPFKG